MSVAELTEDEEKVLGLFRKLKSEKCRKDLFFQGETMVRAQEAVKVDYGIVDPEDSPRKGDPIKKPA